MGGFDQRRTWWRLELIAKNLFIVDSGGLLILLTSTLQLIVITQWLVSLWSVNI